MNTAVAVIAIAAALNPPRRARQLADVPSQSAVAVGAVVALVAHVAVAGLADSLLDGLDISDPNAQIAAAFVIGIRALIDLFTRAQPEPLLANRSLTPLWPVTFPALLRPEVVVAVIAVGGALGSGPVAAGVAIGCAGTVVLHRRLPERVQRWAATAVGVVAIAVTVDLLVDGILSV